MAIRYSRQYAPSNTESLKDFLDTAHLQIERSIDSILEDIGDRQPAISDDASGALNQTTVNDILAALRAWGIIEP